MSGIDWRWPALVGGVGLAVFLVSAFCLILPYDQSHAPIWYANGIAFAALLRTPERRWPAIVAVSALAIFVAGLLFHDTAFQLIVRAPSAAVQFTASAYILRRALGPYFDLTSIRHGVWLSGVTIVVSVLLIAVLAPLATGGDGAPGMTAHNLLRWYLTTSLSTLVIGLPVLSLTARGCIVRIRWNPRSLPIFGVLLALEVLVIVVCFGATAFPGVFAVMPVLMLTAWLFGLEGAGIANLLSAFLVTYFSAADLGASGILSRAGYEGVSSSIYLALFFCVCQVISLPLAAARLRQAGLTGELADALAASEQRAVRLEQSEQAAKAAEANAVEARERLRRVIETSTDIICTLDSQGRFLEISENCLELWGRSRESLIGRYFLGTVVPEERDKLMRDWDLRADRQTKQTIRINHLLPDGTTVPMTWGATWVADELLTHCVGRDMSEYNAMEARVHHAQRMDAIGQLTGGVAHDFNNLLTVVLGSCEAVALEIDDPHLQQQLELALQAGEKCAELTRQLLAFARRQTLTPQAFDVNDRIAAAAPLIMRTLGSDLEFSIRTGGDLRRAFADPLQTETALLNLCLNARDAMPSGGRLLIETANATLGEAYVKRHPDARAGDYVLITVSDTGTGIAPEIIERIFDPFFTTKDIGSGTGLGLSMVHGFVNQSNGHIKVVSKLGRGARFHLYLPVAEPGARPAEESGPMGQALRYGRENVLLVEDHPLVREHLSKKLESLGYDVTVAAHAAEAIEVLEDRDDIDLLLTDVVMPGGMGGFQLGQLTADRWPHIRILYTSGYAPETLTSGGLLQDRAVLLPKPYTKTQLAAKVRAVLDGAFELVC